VKHDGGVLQAGRAIVAVPPTLAGRIRYSPALPPLRDQLTQQVPMGYVTKVQIAYPEPFWRAEGLSGSAFSLDDEVSVMFDNSPPDLSCGVLLGFLEGRQARRAAKLSPEERRDLVLSVFAKFFGPRAADPDEYVEKDWAAEEWSRGCYGGRFGTGVWTGYGRGAAGARGPYPLGGHGDSGDLERLHGRSDTLRGEGRPRSSQRLTASSSLWAEMLAFLFANQSRSEARIRSRSSPVRTVLLAHTTQVACRFSG
jgi:Flavin containing amine oxidoreductase